MLNIELCVCKRNKRNVSVAFSHHISDCNLLRCQWVEQDFDGRGEASKENPGIAESVYRSLFCLAPEHFSTQQGAAEGAVFQTKPKTGDLDHFGLL